MNAKETALILDVLQKAYPRKPADDPQSTLKLWAGMFANDPYPAVEMAVKLFLANDKKGFPPAIGQIKDLIQPAALPEPKVDADWLHETAKRLSNYYHSLGLPSATEAKNQGMSFADWLSAVNRAERGAP